MYWLTNPPSKPTPFDDLRLDIVGIIAVLGEGSVTRNAQVSALSWYNVLPRLLPAPQALLEHERKRRLPVDAGTVVGAYSGNIRHEINYFAQLLHPQRLEPYEVELVEVTLDETKIKPQNDETSSSSDNEDVSFHAYGPREYGLLFFLALLGFAMSMTLIVLAVIWADGFALLTTILLSTVSLMVGVGTHWTLIFPDFKPTRKDGDIPRSDVVIYYPHGAIRVIRCEERISRLYFQTESCEYSLEDTPYRTVASLATVMLIAGVISLSNASNKSQVAFAVAYIVLNFLFWILSALNSTALLTNRRLKHWAHPFTVHKRLFRQQKMHKACGANHTPGKPSTTSLALSNSGSEAGQDQPSQLRLIWTRLQDSWRFRRILMAADHRRKYVETSRTLNPAVRNFTSALWTAIALTGTSSWLNDATHIAPRGPAWDAWIKEAGEEVAGEPGDERVLHDLYEPGHIRQLKTTRTKSFKQTVVERRILLPAWDYQGRLSYHLKAQPIEIRTAPQMERPEKTEVPSRRSKKSTVHPEAAGAV